MFVEAVLIILIVFIVFVTASPPKRQPRRIYTRLCATCDTEQVATSYEALSFNCPHCGTVLWHH